MRRAVLTLALLCVAIAVAAILASLAYPRPLAAALGAVVGLVTVIVGLVAMARRRDWGWLGGLCIVGLLSVGGSSISLFVIPWNLYTITDWDPCPTYPQCAPPPPHWLPLPFEAAPVVVGLVMLLYYSIRMLRPPSPRP